MAQTNANNNTLPSMCVIWHADRHAAAPRWRVWQ